MRLPTLDLSKLTVEQDALYKDMRVAVSAKYSSFQTNNADGAFIGPWNAWLHDPEIGSAVWTLSKAMTRLQRLPDNLRQVAILVVGAHFQAAYEIYAHESVAATRHGMTERQLLALRNNRQPDGLSPEEILAYEVAHTLVQGGVLPEAAYQHALAVLEQPVLNELIYLVGYYSMLSITLNAFDVPAPS